MKSRFLKSSSGRPGIIFKRDPFPGISLCLSVSLSVCLSACLSVCLSVSLSFSLIDNLMILVEKKAAVSDVPQNKPS